MSNGRRKAAWQICMYLYLSYEVKVLKPVQVAFRASFLYDTRMRPSFFRADRTGAPFLLDRRQNCSLLVEARQR